jgi:glycosyltransferase involved in cell wall biosynthesis
MRVCILTGAAHGIGGMQDHTRSLASGLVAAGHDVEVIGDRHSDGILAEERDGARWHYLPFPSRGSRLPRRHRDWLHATYATFRELEATGRFDVVHSESAAAIELLIRKVHREVPIVVEWHGSALAMSRAALRRLRRGDRRAKIREAKGLVWLWIENFQHGHWYKFRPCHWIVPSKAEFTYAWLNGCQRRELGHVVPNGVDTALFRPQDRKRLRDELELGHGPLLVCVGRLEPDKGTHNAIRALASLDGPHRSVRLAIVGDGPERATLESMSRTYGVQDRVSFTGAQPHPVVARYIAAADVFLFPTERAEAAPLVLPQAMACGAAIVTTTIGSIAEVVGSGSHSGVLVPPGNVEALTSAIRELLGDAERRQRLGEAARQRVLAEYTLERMIERTVEVYQRAIADARRRTA